MEDITITEELVKQRLSELYAAQRQLTQVVEDDKRNLAMVEGAIQEWNGFLLLQGDSKDGTEEAGSSAEAARSTGTGTDTGEAAK